CNHTVHAGEPLPPLRIEQPVRIREDAHLDQFQVVPHPRALARSSGESHCVSSSPAAARQTRPLGGLLVVQFPRRAAHSSDPLLPLRATPPAFGFASSTPLAPE